MAKKNESAGDLLLVIVGAVVLLTVVSMLPAFAWLCCDDKMAEIVGLPALGTMSFWQAWAFMFVLGSITHRVKHESKKAN